jgi:hypothetical protein
MWSDLAARIATRVRGEFRGPSWSACGVPQMSDDGRRAIEPEMASQRDYTMVSIDTFVLVCPG